MNRALRLIRRRAISSIPVLLIVIVLTFLLLESASGDAVDAYLLSIGGGDATVAQALRQSYGLDQSMLARLWVYFSSLARLDLGWSVAFGRPVRDLILERLPNTLLLMGSATALSFALGSALGIVAGAKPESIRDRSLSTLSPDSLCDPEFLARPGIVDRLCRAAPLAADLRHRDDRVGQDRACPCRRHRQPPRPAGRRADADLHGAFPARHALRHGRGLAAGLCPLCPLQGLVAHPHRAAARGAQRAPAARHHARPAIGRHARRQRRDRKHLCHSGLRPAGAGGRQPAATRRC